jgi:dTDP-4-amino-4,6-dideoxygalactose transaminase
MTYKIPLFDLNFDEAEELAVIETLRSKWISTGPKSTLFEEKFASMLNANYALSLANCTVALHLAMKICDINAGDEVICPSLTFVATANAIRYVDAIPVFADIKSLDDLTMDPEDIEKKITKKTKAIVVMHYGGFACDMDKIVLIAKKYGLKIIEDACHAPLSEYNGHKLGTIGDVGCFSFFSNKNISTGEGGMIVTNNIELFEKAKLLRSHGMTTLSYERSKGHSTGYDVVELGYNYRMDDIRASIGIVQLDKLLPDLIKRKEVRNWYIRNLENCAKVVIPFKEYNKFTSNYIFTIAISKEVELTTDEVRAKLTEAGIQTSMHYPAVHKFSIYQKYFVNLPQTDQITNQLITLPMHGKLSEDEVNYITDNLIKAVSNG